MGNTDNEKTISHSQAKREERKKEVAHARRTAKTGAIIGYALIAVVAVLVIWGISVAVSRQADKVSPSDDYSAGLEANGYIAGINAADKVTLPADYANIQVPYSEIEYADENIDADIEALVASYETPSDDTNLVVADGDKVQIAYVGTVDGVEFDGGSADDYALTIGSGTFIDTFEEQLIGAHVGDAVTVKVTFPEDYGKSELAGSPAEFAVDIKGIYKAPEFTDEFVAENLSDKASTVDEYRQYVRDTNERASLESYVATYLKDNSTVSKCPKKYVKILKSIQMYDDKQSYQYMNDFYQSYYGSFAYDSFESYVGMSMDEYYESLKTSAKETCEENMIYQAIFEKSGETMNVEAAKALMAETGDATVFESEIQTAGEPFVLQEAIRMKAIDIVADGASIVK